ncbi:zinc finger and BTB domain-containing protein 49 [Osmerus eperlanus]|uniref:zinc finger and BTB domain-containing protein 49 n=1 Tax=Osmerus eperlanus TaxID=29151 RepID=UPI002E0E2854
MDTLSSHSSYLLQQLQEQRIQGLLCDCMLVVKGVCFKAHKNVLAAFSSYFRSLFQNSPSQKNDVFQLVIQDVGGIGQILDYMYTSHLDVNQDNVKALLDIAQFLQVPNVQNMCSTYLKPSLPGVETPSFSLSSVLTSDHDCLLETGLSQDVDIHCPSTEAQKSVYGSGDIDHNKRLPITVPQGTATETTGNAQATPEKQLVHGYKLRNFYNKQYKPRANTEGQGPLVVLEVQQLEFGVTQPGSIPVCSGNTVQSNPPCPPTQIEKSFNLSVPSLETLATPNSEGTDSAVNKLVRPKKAVYLKKYNYLRSQKALEEMCVEPISEPVFSTKEKQDNPLAHNELPEVSVDCLAVEGKVLLESVINTQVSSSPTADQDEPNSKAVNDVAEMAGHKQYCCIVCGKIFKHPSNLELHKRSHTGEKPFQCNMCGKNFSQAGNLQTHLRRHSGEKPYICELCGKSFAASGDVQRHMVVHTGDRPHLCDICGHGFSNFSNLKEHKKTHTTDKTFTCDQCGKSFNMQRKLLKHKVRHSGEKPHHCDTCGKRFIGSGDLQRHVRSHTGERPYICSCSKSFTRSALLRRHSMHCKGTTDSSPAVAVYKNPGCSNGPLFPKLARHSKLRTTTTEQPFPGIMSHPALDKSSPSPTHVESPDLSMHRGAPPTSNTLPELQSFVPHHLLSSSQQDKCLPSPPQHPPELLKLSKPHLPQDGIYGPYLENGAVGLMQAGPVTRGGMGKHYLPEPDNTCGQPVANRTIGAHNRTHEGQFFSSVTLWGLAMKTLQNDNDME